MGIITSEIVNHVCIHHLKAHENMVPVFIAAAKLAIAFIYCLFPTHQET
ncbi:hypothetical protein [Anabaena sp. CCY 9910]